MSRSEPSSFGATLRFELASEEERPLFVSYVVASLLALAWLTLVHVIPSPLDGARAADEPTVITFAPWFDTPAPPRGGDIFRIDEEGAGKRVGAIFS